MKEAPEAFIETFIQKSCRERVAHEWKKKQEKLYYKVCHKPEELFISKYEGKKSNIKENENCYVLLGGNVMEQMPFHEAKEYIGCGDGVLIVTLNGSMFYAESESTKGHPYVTYANG